jgi:dedicated sortase system histidine kinase
MPLRYQLLLLSLLTLLLPWGGCRYAREMEKVLRTGQEQSLVGSAETLAGVLAARPELLDAGAGPRTPLDPGAGDLYAHHLSGRPLLDGYADDWGVAEDAFASLSSPGGALRVRYIAGADDTYLYLLLEVADSVVTLEQGTDPRVPPEERGDHVWIAFDSPRGLEQSFFFATSAPGLISARRATESRFGERGEQIEPQIQAYWQPDPSGYHLEARVPLAMIGASVGFEVVDAATPGTAPVRLGNLDVATHRPLGRLLMPSAALSRELATLMPPGSHVVVSDVNGWVLGEAGSLQPQTPGVELSDPIDSDRPAEWLQAVYRGLLESANQSWPERRAMAGRLSGEPFTNAAQGRQAWAWFRLRDERRSLVSVAVPIESAAGRLGVLTIEQAGDRLLTLRDRALTRLLNVTLIATVAAVIATLLFATILGIRLSRLKLAAETALSADGRLNAVIPETHRRDELGDLARSYAELLRHLNEYTVYLRTLAGKLSHELRTPLAIVRSSLENLESERSAGGNLEPYLERAREGTDRLQAILAAMSAATRTEQAIQHAERSPFELGEVVRGTTRAYADAFRERRFVAEVPDTPCWILGTPDLIVQLLDKLVENAVDFSAPGSTIRLELQIDAAHCVLSVVNQGEHIPPAVRERVFDSMFQFRRDSSQQPHFGLGLYIVRLVADFHGGVVFTENLSAPAAVRFGVRLPTTPPP